jgi:Flp pilus assembly pilin Flp
MLAILTSLEINVRELLSRATRPDAGAGIVEYLLLVVFIALAMVVTLAFFTGQLSAGFTRAGNSIPA